MLLPYYERETLAYICIFQDCPEELKPKSIAWNLQTTESSIRATLSRLRSRGLVHPVDGNPPRPTTEGLLVYRENFPATENELGNQPKLTAKQ